MSADRLTAEAVTAALEPLGWEHFDGPVRLGGELFVERHIWALRERYAGGWEEVLATASLLRFDDHNKLRWQGETSVILSAMQALGLLPAAPVAQAEVTITLPVCVRPNQSGPGYVAEFRCGGTLHTATAATVEEAVQALAAALRGEE